MREMFAGQLAAIERGIHDAMRRAVMTLAIVADAVHGPMSVWSEAIVTSAADLRRVAAGADSELLAVTARQAPVAGDLRLVLALLQVAQHVALIAHQFELISQQLDLISASPPDDAGGGQLLREMARLGGGPPPPAVRALVSRDTVVARSIDHDDDAIDRLNRSVFAVVLGSAGGEEQRELGMRQILI